MADGGSYLRLSMPPQSEQLSTLRSFALAVGRQEGLDPETVEDLTLALSEIAADGIETGGSAIRVSVLEDPRAIEIAVEIPDAGHAPGPAVDHAQVVRALFPTVRVDRRADATVTIFSMERG